MFVFIGGKQLQCFFLRNYVTRGAFPVRRCRSVIVIIDCTRRLQRDKQMANNKWRKN